MSHAGTIGSGTPPELVRRVLARLDEAGSAGRVRLSESSVRPRGPAAPRAARAEERDAWASWDALRRRLPPDWSDLYAEIELDSSDYLDRGALLLAPVNPPAPAGASSFRARANSRATASRPGWPAVPSSASTTRGSAGALRVLRVLSDTNPPLHAGARVASRTGAV